MTNPQAISHITSNLSAADALTELTKLLEREPDNPHAHVAIGKVYWRLGHRGEAMSAYEKAAALDPDGPGRLLLEHSNSIMDFFNPDLLNP